VESWFLGSGETVPGDSPTSSGTGYTITNPGYLVGDSGPVRSSVYGTTVNYPNGICVMRGAAGRDATIPNIEYAGVPAQERLYLLAGDLQAAATPNIGTIGIGQIEQANVAGVSPGVSTPPKIANPIAPIAFNAQIPNMPPNTLVTANEWAIYGPAGYTVPPTYGREAYETIPLIMKTGPDAGELATTRIVLFVDHHPYPEIAQPQTDPLAGDLFETEGFTTEFPTAVGLYNMENQHRWSIIEDQTHVPQAGAHSHTVVQPAKYLDNPIDVIFGSPTPPPGSSIPAQYWEACTDGKFYLGVFASDMFTLVPAASDIYKVDGIVRLFYTDD